MVGFFLAGLLYPLAGALVRVILGAQWDAAAPIFAALTLLCLSRPLAIATGWLYTSQGRGRDLLVTALLDGVCVVSAFVIGLQFGRHRCRHRLLGIQSGGRNATDCSTSLAGEVRSRHAICGSLLLASFRCLQRSWPRRGSQHGSGSSRTAVRPQDLILCLSVGTAAGLATIWAFPRNRCAVRGVLNATERTQARPHQWRSRGPTCRILNASISLPLRCVEDGYDGAP